MFYALTSSRQRSYLFVRSDSCFNSGMSDITKLIGTQTAQYATCIPTGNRLTDTVFHPICNRRTPDAVCAARSGVRG
jgi:hypothetical protein